jgi:hypothetical protein
MFQALFCSSSVGTVRIAIGIFLCVLFRLAASRFGVQCWSGTPTLLAVSRHNTHKNIPIAIRTVPADGEQKSTRNM